MPTAGQIGFNESAWGGFTSGDRPIGRYVIHLGKSASSLYGIVQGDLIEITARWATAPNDSACDGAVLTITRGTSLQSITVDVDESEFGILISTGVGDGVAEARFYVPTQELHPDVVFDLTIEFDCRGSSESWHTKLGLVSRD